jgi:AAA15 family ATPase/GTPase
MKLELKSLRVINCGPLKDLTINFCDPEGTTRPVIVLGGSNGSGKTTVLELIVALSNLLNNKVDLSIFNRLEYAEMVWRVDDKEFSIFFGRPPAELKLAPNSFGIASLEYGQDTSDLVIMRTQYAEGTLSTEITSLIERQEKQRIEFPHIGKTSIVSDYFPLPSVLYFPHIRNLPTVKGNQVNREETIYQWVYTSLPGAAFPGSLDSYLIWLEYAEPETFARVCKFLKSVNLDGKTFSVNRKELKTVVHTQDDGQHFLEQLSSGEQNILIMLLELQRRLLPHSIVLIDEIENSLHPAYQYKLAKALLKMQEQIPFQLIVTTHSTAFVDAFGTESVRILTDL